MKIVDIRSSGCYTEMRILIYLHYKRPEQPPDAPPASNETGPMGSTTATQYVTKEEQQ
jgi:hypothetical protein